MRHDASPEIWLIIIILAIIVLFIRIFFVDTWDKDRISDDARKRGWKIKKISWEPFGPGWISEKNDRIYKVELINNNGRTENKYCKTSLNSVYWK